MACAGLGSSLGTPFTKAVLVLFCLHLPPELPCIHSSHSPSILPGYSAMNNEPGSQQGQVVGLEGQQLPGQQPGRLRLVFALGEGHVVYQEKTTLLMTNSCPWAAAPHSVC